jgi:hypothetical protein
MDPTHFCNISCTAIYNPSRDSFPHFHGEFIKGRLARPPQPQQMDYDTIASAAETTDYSPLEVQ